MSLPIVHEDLFGAKLASLRGDSEYDTRIYEIIREENPALCTLIEAILEEDRYSEDFKHGYCKAAAQFYDLLRTQAEVDEMNNVGN